MNILVTGAGGQLGREMIRAVEGTSHRYFFTTRQDLDIADAFCKVIPGADSLITVMVNPALSGLSAFYNINDSRSQIARVSRRAHLVENDIDMLLGGEQPQHRLHEVLAPLGIQPRCSENQVIAPGINDCLLPFQLGFAIDAYRSRRAART